MTGQGMVGIRVWWGEERLGMGEEERGGEGDDGF